MKFMPYHAALLMEAHEVEALLDNPEEFNALNENNPDLLGAYIALKEVADGNG